MQFIRIFTLVSLWLLAPILLTIHVTLLKNYIHVPVDDYYKFHVAVNRSNADLIPLNITVDYTLTNSIPSLGKNFDFFYYLQQTDIECYYHSLYNNSFLFPCPFLTNNQTILRESQVLRLNQYANIPVGIINNVNLTYIVDNTRYPYPEGAYPQGPVDIYSQIVLKISLDDSYMILGVRLVFINITVLLLYAIFIGKLVFDQRKIKNLMNEKEGNNYKISTSSPQDNQNRNTNQSIGDISEGSESYDQGYQVLMNPDLIKSTNKNISSMLSSNGSIMRKQS